MIGNVASSRLRMQRMDRFIHYENIAHFRKLIAVSSLEIARDEERYKMLLSLLADELAKDQQGDALSRSLDELPDSAEG